MDEWTLYTKDIRVQVRIRDAVPYLSAQPGVELIFRDRFQHRSCLICGWVFRVARHAHRLCGDGDFVYALPRPLEVRSTRLDNSNLRIDVARLLLLIELICYGKIQRRDSR